MFRYVTATLSNKMFISLSKRKLEWYTLFIDVIPTFCLILDSELLNCGHSVTGVPIYKIGRVWQTSISFDEKSPGAATPATDGDTIDPALYEEFFQPFFNPSATELQTRLLNDR